MTSVHFPVDIWMIRCEEHTNRVGGEITSKLILQASTLEILGVKSNETSRIFVIRVKVIHCVYQYYSFIFTYPHSWDTWYVI